MWRCDPSIAVQGISGCYNPSFHRNLGKISQVSCLEELRLLAAVIVASAAISTWAGAGDRCNLDRSARYAKNSFVDSTYDEMNYTWLPLLLGTCSLIETRFSYGQNLIQFLEKSYIESRLCHILGETKVEA